MIERTRFRRIARHARLRTTSLWRFVKREAPDQFTLWLIAVAVGLVSGYGVIGLRLSISGLQNLVYGADDLMLASHVRDHDWRLLIAVPVAGGLIVGAILKFFLPQGRAHVVADVIEASALNNARVDGRTGLASLASALVTLSMGGSTGREGPAVHFGATIASWVSDRLDATKVTAREILGCAVAAAVAASFNAPIAGALFALEVVLRHYAVRAFGPIAVASVAGAIVSRVHLGDVTEFTLPGLDQPFYAELPAFLLLGVVSAAVAVVFMRSIFLAEDVGDLLQRRLRVPIWLRPAIAGAMLGALAIEFPEIIGVGYETTTRALLGGLGFGALVAIAVAKTAAVAITMAGRFGGGVFSPSLMLGALTGAAFGVVATQIFPAVSGSVGLYALAGMGAVSAAVLGAPISTTLIVFELTGDYRAGIAVMVSVSVAVVLARKAVAKSFFLTQLDRRKVHIAEGPEGYLPATIGVRDVMRPRGAEAGASDMACESLIEQGAWLRPTDTLERALPMFDQLRNPFLPVAVEEEEGGEKQLLGAVFHIDALRAYNRVLVETHKEEHA